ncbi:hypothetical protein FQN50_002380 [Emmonsiellopsis sp. PD_5]|nr:hypothetical protein FQN50_002380 [Emmonsiellopsis sp. PD_5]
MTRPIYDLMLRGQQVLVAGQRASYLVDRAIKSNVFEGHIQGTSTPVMIKTEDLPILYKREVGAYQFNCIQNSPVIRSLHEAVDNGTDKCLVFEWMDSDLWSLRHQRRSPSNALPKVVAKSVLQALTAFADMDGQGAAVHTDVNPNNILVSGADSASPIVKLADLGGLIRSGRCFDERIQGLAIRAPEVWMGKPVTPACDVWSVGVSLAHFLATKTLFGPSGLTFQISLKSPETSKAAWSIGNLFQLVGLFPWEKDSQYAEEFELANSLVTGGLIDTKSLEDELSVMKVPKDCVEFIRHLLTWDPDERPTAEQALRHPWLQDVA